MFDIDGVLADVAHRAHYLDRTPKDWVGFFAAVEEDRPWTQGIDLALESAKDCDLLYLTGRPERTRRATQTWLDVHGLPPGKLLMRGNGDRRPARTFKPTALNRRTRDRSVAVVVDDDAGVCAAYAASGYRVLHATWAVVPVVVAEAQDHGGRT